MAQIDLKRAEIMEPLISLPPYIKQRNDSLNKTAETKKEKLKKNKDKIIEKLPTTQQGLAYYSMKKREKENIISKQRRYQNYSFIMMIYSTLENIFRKMCQAIEKRKDISYKFNCARKEKNYPYEQAKDFFRKNEGLDFLKDNEMQFYNNFKKIRNCVVHHSGIINHSKHYCHIKNLVKKYDDIKLKEDAWNEKFKKLDVNIDYCKKCLKCFIDIFDRLFENLGFGPREIKID